MQIRLTCSLLALCTSVAAVLLKAPTSSTATSRSGQSLVPDAVDHDAGQWQTKIEAALAGFHFMEREPAASSEADKKVAQDMGPLQMQVPDKEFNILTGKLTAACRKQFMAIVRGTGPAIHTFGAPGTNASAESCQELEGGLCAIDASVMQQKDSTSRQMSSTTSVRGKGCLPRKCMAGTDLDVLVGFMQGKAKSALPGGGIQVKLSVDCSKSGGGVELAKPAGITEIFGEKKGEKGNSVGTRSLVGALLAPLAALVIAF